MLFRKYFSDESVATTKGNVQSSAIDEDSNHCGCLVGK
jgi:hypothetical protein